MALGETKELIAALDCVEIDELVPLQDVVAAQDLADRVAARLTKLIRSSHAELHKRAPGGRHLAVAERTATVDRDCAAVTVTMTVPGSRVDFV